MAEHLSARFRNEVEGLVSKFQHLSYSWDVKDEQSSIRFPKTKETGFDVTVSVYGASFSIETDLGWHHHEHDVDWVSIEERLGMVRDLLCTTMRIREMRSGGKPYCWVVETFDGSAWRRESSTGLIFWNYFGSKSEQIFQNDTLPERTTPV